MAHAGRGGQAPGRRARVAAGYHPLCDSHGVSDERDPRSEMDPDRYVPSHGDHLRAEEPGVDTLPLNATVMDILSNKAKGRAGDQDLFSLDVAAPDPQPQPLQGLQSSFEKGQDKGFRFMTAAYLCNKLVQNGVDLYRYRGGPGEEHCDDQAIRSPQPREPASGY